MAKDTISIITVVYNNYTVLEDFMKSLQSQTNKNWELFIADLSDKKQPIKGYDIPFTIIDGENKGYAHGVNLGIKEAIKKNITKYRN